MLYEVYVFLVKYACNVREIRGDSLRKITLITIIIILCLFVTSTTALAAEEGQAEEGQLEINTEALRDTREDVEHRRAIGHELAPTLFLCEMTEQEAKRQEAESAWFAEIQEILFLEEFPPDTFSTEEIVSNLFLEHPLESVRVRGDTPSNHITTPMPTWAIAILLVLGLAVLIWIGVLFGRWLAKRKSHKEAMT